MQTIICPQCGIANGKKRKVCKKCKFPIKQNIKMSNFLVVPILILLFVMLFSIGTFVYIEYNYPNYGIRTRVRVAWKILTDKEWIIEYKKLEELSQKKAKTNQKQNK